MGRVKVGQESFLRPTEVLACLAVVRRHLTTWASLRDTDLRPRVIFDLTGPSAQVVEEVKTYTILPFFNTGGQWFWISFSLAYELRLGDLVFDAASLVVFNGLVDGPKNLIVRAEWDRTDNHPQPHWHLYPPADIDAGLASNLVRIHLPSCASWYNGDATAHSVPFTMSALAGWLDGTISILRHEIVTVARRT